MDDFDIYDDLQLLQEQGKQKAEEDSQWKEKYHVALGTIEKLQAEKKELSKKIKLLETNFSSLLETARTEIKRKDNQINELRREKDDLCFRRVVRPGGKHSHHDAVPHSSRNDHVDQGAGAGNTKPFSKHSEENKGNLSEGSGQRRNPFQGESSGRLGSSGDKTYKGRNSTKHQNLSDHGNLDSVAHSSTRSALKQENVKEKITNRTEDIQKATKALNNENISSVRSTKECGSASTLMEEEILNDLKEFKKRKQSDVKQDSESEELAVISAKSNEKNLFFDALFDDLAGNEENSKDAYSDLEAERSEKNPEAETCNKKIRYEEDSIAEMRPITPKVLETTLDDHKKFSTKQVNLIEMDKKTTTGVEQKHNSPSKKPVVDTPNIVRDCNDPTVEPNSITNPTLKRDLKSSNNSKPFVFVELDSSFYSSDDEEGIKNGQTNVKELNKEKVADDADKKIENKSKRNKNVLPKDTNKNESTSNSDGNDESKSKNSREKHISERTNVKAAKKDSYKHSNRSKHSESLSRSKVHTHEQESREGRSSREPVRKPSSGGLENKKKRKSPLKMKHDLQHNNGYEYVTLGKHVALQEIESLSFDEKIINKESVDGKEGAQCHKTQTEETASSNFEIISDDEEAFEKTTDVLRESATRQDDLIANKVDKSLKNEAIDKEVQEPLHNANKTTEEKLNEPNNTSEAKLHEDKKDNASSTQSVLDNKFKCDTAELKTHDLTNNSDIISASPQDESKNVKDKQQKRNEQLLTNTVIDATCSNTKAESVEVEIASMSSKNNISPCVCKSIDVPVLNSEVVPEPKGQLQHSSEANDVKEKMDILGTNQSTVSETVPEKHCDNNLIQTDLKLNQANESNTDSVKENGIGTTTHKNLSKKSKASIKQQMEKNIENHAHHVQVENKVPILESDVDENEHVEMPRLLVEEEAEDVTSVEKFTGGISISENINTNITTENRIHHKKRILQNSITAEEVKLKPSIQSAVGSNRDSSQLTRINKFESCKTSLDTTNSHALGSQFCTVAGASSGQSPLESTEQCDTKERCKKNVLLKFENSSKIVEKTDQSNSSVLTPCDKKANSSSSQCNKNNDNTDSEKLICKGSDIKETPNHDPVSNKIDWKESVSKKKFGNSSKIVEKTDQSNSSVLTPCDKKANSSSSQCNKNNDNTDSEKLMCKGSDIKETPNHDPVSNKIDWKESVSKKKFENSSKIMEKTDQSNSSVLALCDKKANSSSSQCNKNNHNTDSEKLMCKGRDIKATPNDDHVSKKLDSKESVSKEPIEVAESNTLCKQNSLQNCNKDENITLKIQCDKRKRPFAIEPETANNTKVLKSHKNEQKHKEAVSNKPTSDIHKDSIVSLVSNINPGDLNVPKSGNVSTPLNPSLESSTVPPKDTSKKQSNEISSRIIVKNEKAMNNCKENLKSHTTDNPNSNDSPVINEDRNVVYLKRRSKGSNTSKEKRIKRKLSSESLEEAEEEKSSKTKKSKKMEAKSPNELKELPSNNKKQIKPATENKNKCSSVSSDEPVISGSNSDILRHNIFSNDGCPEDRNLPVICNDNDDIQYREIENRLESIFYSPNYKSPKMENVIDPKYDTLPQEDNDTILNHTINETLNKSEKSQCDTSSSSRKISVGSNDYVIETVGAHVANVFVTRKRCKKRTKIAVATV